MPPARLPVLADREWISEHAELKQEINSSFRVGDDSPGMGRARTVLLWQTQKHVERNRIPRGDCGIHDLWEFWRTTILGGNQSRVAIIENTDSSRTKR